MLHDLPKTGIVIPCYQEANRLSKKEYFSFSQKNPNIHFLFVNDGSKDETYAILNDLKKEAKENIDVLDLKHNVGKAEAVRLGIGHILRSKDFQYVGFLDADLSTPLNEFEHLIEFIISHKNIKMVTGSRIRRMGAKIERPWIRHYVSRIIATVAGWALLKIPVYDTQCGAKVFDSQLACFVFGEQFVSRWLFDMELYCRVIKSVGREEALNIIYEVPLRTWCHVGNSKVSFKELSNVPIEMLRIYSKYFR